MKTLNSNDISSQKYQLYYDINQLFYDTMRSRIGLNYFDQDIWIVQRIWLEIDRHHKELTDSTINSIVN
jgi:hypothetical protein